MKIKMSPISKGDLDSRHNWPPGTYLQGGEHGVVFVRGGQSYGTAFVEAFHQAEPKLFHFVRGEGETVQDAEDACWAKVAKYVSCAGHEYETRGYTNGAGFCKHCGMFASEVFTAEQLGQFCAACGTPTKWHSEPHDPVGEIWLCEDHTPHRDGWACGCPTCRAKQIEHLNDEDFAEALNSLLLGPSTSHPEPNEARCPSWEGGVAGPCDECGRADVLEVAERDYLDVPTSFQCRCCMTGHCDELEPNETETANG